MRMERVAMLLDDGAEGVLIACTGRPEEFLLLDRP
jgi:hypothetical protein